MLSLNQSSGGPALDSVLVIANHGFAERLVLVEPGEWSRPTPCSEWDVRALVNHVIGANVRYELLLHGASLVEVEATRQADHLGEDPVASFRTSSARLVDCFREPAVLDRTFRHVTGERSGTELLVMRILDVGVHSWDLARAIGATETIDTEVVAVALTATTEGDHDDDASAQDRLLVRSGRHPTRREL